MRFDFFRRLLRSPGYGCFWAMPASAFAAGRRPPGVLRWLLRSFAWPLLTVFVACAPMPPAMDTRAAAGESRQGSERIYITDRRGERFDITHAVQNYGMSRHGFEYGIGKNAMRPLDHPEMIAPGEPAYPGAWDTIPVIGTEIEGDVRSYPIRPLARHEIVNETIGETPFAVAY